jgi:hypothetical protein
MFNTSGLTNKISYKVIRPYTSQRLHFSNTLEGGASKCYREIKSLNKNITDFSVMNMLTNEIYDYKLNKVPLQSGGVDLPSIDMKKIEEKLESLEKRVIKLENVQNVNAQNVNDIKLSAHSAHQQSIKPESVKIESVKHESPKQSGGMIPAGPVHSNSDFAKAFL